MNIIFIRDKVSKIIMESLFEIICCKTVSYINKYVTPNIRRRNSNEKDAKKKGSVYHLTMKQT